MKWKQCLITPLLAFLLLLAATGSNQADDEDSHYPVTITNYDYAGNEVEYTYEKAPEKVVAVYQGSIEIMIALGLEDHVIASYGLDNEVKDQWKEGFEKMNYQEDVFAPDKETVTLLEPDMILSWGSLFSEKQLGDVAAWNEKGVATYINSNTRAGGHPRTLENEYTDILNLGKIFDVEDRAQALVDEMKASVESTLSAAQGQDPVSVAVVALREGRVVGSGPPQQLLTPTFIREVYEVEAQVSRDSAGLLRIFYQPGYLKE